MDESYAIRRYEQAAALLPLRWQQQARQLAPGQMALAEELRLRAGRPMTVLLPEGEITPGQGGQSPTVTQTDLEQLCDAVTDYSRYAAGDTQGSSRKNHRDTVSLRQMRLQIPHVARAMIST